MQTVLLAPRARRTPSALNYWPPLSGVACPPPPLPGSTPSTTPPFALGGSVRCGLLLLLLGHAGTLGYRLGRGLRPLGGLLGCLFIPLYAFGYSALARVIRSTQPIPAQIVWIGGIAFAALGAFMAVTQSAAILGVEPGTSAGDLIGSAALIREIWFSPLPTTRPTSQPR